MIAKTLKIGLLFIAICFCISCSESANEPKSSHRLIGSWRCDFIGMDGQKTGSYTIQTYKENGKYESFDYSVQWADDPIFGNGYTYYGTYSFDENSKLLNVIL